MHGVELRLSLHSTTLDASFTVYLLWSSHPLVGGKKVARDPLKYLLKKIMLCKKSKKRMKFIAFCYTLADVLSSATEIQGSYGFVNLSTNECYNFCKPELRKIRRAATLSDLVSFSGNIM